MYMEHIDAVLKNDCALLPVIFQVVLLTWWAVFRDSFYYILSVLALIAVSWTSSPPVFNNEHQA